MSGENSRCDSTESFHTAHARAHPIFHIKIRDICFPFDEMSFMSYTKNITSWRAIGIDSPFACTVPHDYTACPKFDVEVASTPFLPLIIGKHFFISRNILNAPWLWEESGVGVIDQILKDSFDLCVQLQLMRPKEVIGIFILNQTEGFYINLHLDKGNVHFYNYKQVVLGTKNKNIWKDTLFSL